MKMKPEAWKIETIPKISSQPARANYYRRTFDSAMFRRQVFQFMFGGILRAIFGIYARSKYWDVTREKNLQEEIKKEYLETKRKGLYGIYCFEVRVPFRLSLHTWPHGQPRDKVREHSQAFGRGARFYARVDRLKGKPRVDLEYSNDKLECEVGTISFKKFTQLLKGNYLRKLNDDGKIFKLARGARIAKSRGQHIKEGL